MCVLGEEAEEVRAGAPLTEFDGQRARPVPMSIPQVDGGNGGRVAASVAWSIQSRSLAGQVRCALDTCDGLYGPNARPTTLMCSPSR